MRIIRNYLFFEEQEEDLQHVQAPLALQDRLRQEGGREGGREDLTSDGSLPRNTSRSSIPLM